MSASTAEQIAQALGAKRNGTGWMAHCIAHDDTTPSLSISAGANGRPLLKCHAGCEQAAVIEQLKARGLWHTSDGLTLAELAAAKHLPQTLLRESGFSDDTVNGRAVVRMEYRDASGNVTCVRYRGALEKSGKALRFWFRRGDRQQLFGLWRLRAEDIVIVEGETDACALWAAGFNAIGVPGADAWRDQRFAQHLKGCPRIFVHVEPDEGGEKFRAAFERSALRDRVRFFSVAPAAKDPCELRARDPDAFRQRIETAIAEATPPASGCETAREHEAQASHAEWPAPQELPEGLPPVAAFDYELLPPPLRRRVEDIAERMQCPPDFPAVALMVMLSSLVGRRCGMAPKRSDDWLVVPNLWGMVIGRPGIMKSPPLTEIMRPLQVLQACASERYEREQIEHQAGAMVAAEAERVARDAIRKLLKSGRRTDAQERAQEIAEAEGAEPVCRRYVVNDTTVEKLGEILNQNPHGVLLFRDELSGFFRTLERQGHEADRAFYLECWNGDNGFTYDRIGRGTLHIAGACLSILGSIQPGPLAALVRSLRGSGDDGLLQRFQLAVWPDVRREWRNVDRPPDRAARDAVQRIIERLDGMNAERLGADPGSIPALRFSDDAQALFDVWREALELRLRSDTEHPMLEAHLAKYRSLVPSLALVLHLTECEGGPVERLALERAIAWVEYLETHARRIYAPALSPDMDAARALAKRIKAGALGHEFTLRMVYNNGWTGLGTRDEVAAAVAVLADHDWIREATEPTGGRTRTVYRINPAVLPAEPQP